MPTLAKKYQTPKQTNNQEVKKVSNIETKQILFGDNRVRTEKKERTEVTAAAKSLESFLEIPQEIKLTIREIGQGKFLNFQTDRGTLNYKWPEEFPLSLKQQEGRQVLHLICAAPQKYAAFSVAIRGIHQVLVGVAKGYKTKLKLVGVGYKAFLADQNKLKISLGYSHVNYHSLDSTVAVKFNRKNTRFHLSGISLPVVSGTAAALHALKKPDVYKGKGVRYKGIPLVKKEGKKKK